MWVLCGRLLLSVHVGYAEIPDTLFLIRSIDKNCLVLNVYTKKKNPLWKGHGCIIRYVSSSDEKEK